MGVVQDVRMGTHRIPAERHTGDQAANQKHKPEAGNVQKMLLKVLDGPGIRRMNTLQGLQPTSRL